MKRLVVITTPRLLELELRFRAGRFDIVAGERGCTVELFRGAVA